MAMIKSVCVYCGASARVAEVHREAARQLGTLLARAGIQLVYGGGRVGLMGLVADAALAAGGRVVGIIPEHIKVLEVDHGALTELVVVDSMHARKRLMVDRSDAFVVLPGGLGTLDEAFEVLTWRQLRLHDKPVVIVDVAGYWAPLLHLVEHLKTEGFLTGNTAGLFRVVDTVDRVLEALRAEPEPVTPVDSKWM
jgi:uncharacterized protein (TIGR00730 family)